MRLARGFTLPELVVVMGIFILLLSIGIMGLAPNFSHAEVNAGSDLLLADVKSQQAKAMAGETSLGGANTPHGIYTGADYYTLFSGVFDPNSPANITTTLPTGTTLASTFPSNIILFVPGSGEIDNFQSGQNSLTLTSAGYTDLLEFNQYGVRIASP